MKFIEKKTKRGKKNEGPYIFIIYKKLFLTSKGKKKNFCTSQIRYVS